MTLTLTNALAIGAGGAAGSLARYVLAHWVQNGMGRGFPFGTLAVNVLGCLAMGALYVFFSSRGSAGSETLRVGVLIGVLGGFTTFSSFSMETVSLIEDGELMKAILYTAASFVLCVGATALGVVMARQW